MKPSQSPSPDLPGFDYECRQYGSHSLQRIGIWRPAGSATATASQSTAAQSRDAGYWLVYIHGGAWRDPRRTHLDIEPSLRYLVASPSRSTSSLRGFASIDYRLSPHPDFPQDASTPGTELRTARHPDHVDDVRAAITLLSDELPGVAAGRYLLIGHSAGATLAYQLLMGRDAFPCSAETRGATTEEAPPPPAAVLGLAGIYDLVSIDERHGGTYTGFIGSAFGADRQGWADASPALFTGSFAPGGRRRRLDVLAWSREDSLVDEPEVDVFAAKLARDGVAVVVDKSLGGDHDQAWEDGEQVCRLVEETLARLNQ